LCSAAPSHTFCSAVTPPVGAHWEVQNDVGMSLMDEKQSGIGAIKDIPKGNVRKEKSVHPQ